MASPKVEVYVKLPTGKTCSMQLMPSETVRAISRHLADEESCPEDRIILKYTGKVIDKSKTIGFLGIRAETILKAEIITPKSLNIYVKLVESGKVLPLSLENVSPIRLIKDFVHTTEDIPPSKQQLKVGGNILTNPNQKAFEAGIKEETIVQLEIKEEEPEVKTKTSEASTSKAAAKDNQDISEGDKDAVLGSFDAAGKAVEVVFAFDTTGSMMSCLEQVRTKLRETVTRLLHDIPNIRIGVMAMGDYCDYNNYVVKTIELTSDTDALVDFVKSVGSTGGGDAPECYEWVLRKAQQLDWSEESAKALVMIGDCEPHPPSYTDQQVNWHDELDVLKGMGVKVYGVRAQNSENAAPFYAEISEQTGGAYIQFKNFSIITEMFLAVCYREADPEQLEAFCDEIETQENVNDDMKEMLKQMKEAPKEVPAADKNDKPKRHVNQAWWDVSLDNGSPQYAYDAQTDKWGPYHNTNTSSAATPAPGPGPDWTSGADSGSGKKKSKRFSFRKKKSHKYSPPASPSSTESKKGKCAIM